MAYALLIEGACAARRAKRRREDSGRPAAAGVTALLALGAAGCFTRPNNHPPEITVGGRSAPQRKQPGLEPYMANASDPDGDQPKVMWYVAQSPCTDANDRANWPPVTDWMASTPDPDKLMIDGSDIDGPFCVWAFATDSRGAVRASNFAVDPLDQPPTPNIRVVAPNPSPNSTTNVLYPLYSTIELSPDGSTDPEGDTLTWSWMLQPPPGSGAVRADCNNGHECFTADVQGNYEVTLMASDPTPKTVSTSLTITVNGDQPPCIMKTAPLYQLQTPRLFDPTMPYVRVDEVDDDGDPYPSPLPAQTLHFRWSLSVNGGGFAPAGADFHLLPLPSSENPGVIVKVRLEVLDRNPATANALFGCGDDKDFCYAGAGTGCPQRVSWSYEY